MNRAVALGLASLVASTLFLAAAFSQEEMLTVGNEAFENPQRPPSRFEHDAHNEVVGIQECNVCHHVYRDGQIVPDESSEDQMCADCHALEASDGQPSLIRAFHGNCKGCHMQQGKGPVMCGECHVRN